MILRGIGATTPHCTRTSNAHFGSGRPNGRDYAKALLAQKQRREQEPGATTWPLPQGADDKSHKFGPGKTAAALALASSLTGQAQQQH